jgi:hypothetical protein
LNFRTGSNAKADTLASIPLAKHRQEVRPENLEIHRRQQTLQGIPVGRQIPMPILKIPKPNLT